MYEEKMFTDKVTNKKVLSKDGREAPCESLYMQMIMFTIMTNS